MQTYIARKTEDN